MNKTHQTNVKITLDKASLIKAIEEAYLCDSVSYLIGYLSSDLDIDSEQWLKDLQAKRYHK